MNFCAHCGQPLPRPIYEVGQLRVDTAERRVTFGDEEIILTPLEFTILETLVRRPGMLFTRDAILERLDDCVSEDSLKVTISSLRRKLSGAATIPDGRQAGLHGTRAYKLTP